MTASQFVLSALSLVLLPVVLVSMTTCDRNMATASERAPTVARTAAAEAAAAPRAELPPAESPSREEPRISPTPAEKKQEARRAETMGLALEDARGGGAAIVGVGGRNPSLAMLQPGDVVVSADGARVRGAHDLERRLSSMRAGGLALLEVKRHGATELFGVQAPGAAPRPQPSPSRAPTPPPAPREQIIVIVPTPAQATMEQPVYATMYPPVYAGAYDIAVPGAGYQPPNISMPSGFQQTTSVPFMQSAEINMAFPPSPGAPQVPQIDPFSLAPPATPQAVPRMAIPGANNVFAPPVQAIGTPATNRPGFVPR